MAAKYPLVLNGTAIQELQSGDIVATYGLTTGAPANSGTITGTWSLTSGSSLQSTYADLAEYYTSDKQYEPGTVLVFGGDAEVTVTKTFGDSRVAGVVSTSPAYIMNSEINQNNQAVCIALQGRVPCKVVGPVRKGDLLTTAGIFGHAARAINPTVGTIIGKSLEDKDSADSSIIEISIGRA